MINIIQEADCDWENLNPTNYGFLIKHKSELRGFSLKNILALAQSYDLYVGLMTEEPKDIAELRQFVKENKEDWKNA